MNLESYGIDIPIAHLEQMAHHEFNVYQTEMQEIAAKIAQQRGWKDTDYRSVCRTAQTGPISGDAVLPFYKKRLAEIEEIIAKQNLVTLPDRPARIRIATAAESSAQPAPHMVPPPLLNNTGQQGEFVLPLNLPPQRGRKEGTEIRRLLLRRRDLDDHRPRGAPRPRAAIRFDGRARCVTGPRSLCLQQYQRRRLGPLRRIHHQAVHAARRPAHLAADAPAARRQGIHRSGTSVRQDEA